MKIDEFVMERWQSEWEHIVDYNISESGVKALDLIGEVLTDLKT